MYNYNDAYILVRSDISIAGHNLVTEVAFKNCAPFTKCMIKIDGTTIDDAEDLDLVMLMYNLIEYISSLRFYSKDKATNFNNDIENTDDFKSFKYKAKLVVYTTAQPAPNQANGILRNGQLLSH